MGFWGISGSLCASFPCGHMEHITFFLCFPVKCLIEDGVWTWLVRSQAVMLWTLLSWFPLLKLVESSAQNFKGWRELCFSYVRSRQEARTVSNQVKTSPGQPRWRHCSLELQRRGEQRLESGITPQVLGQASKEFGWRIELWEDKRTKGGIYGLKKSVSKQPFKPGPIFCMEKGKLLVQQNSWGVLRS